MHLDLSKISFPVYKLGNVSVVSDNGKDSVFHSRTLVSGEVEYRELIIDDKNINEETLARRRLRLRESGANLFKLKDAVFLIGDFIKLAKTGIWFIDSEGQIFEYKKTTRVPIVFKKIKNVIPARNGGAIIEVEGISARFKVLFPPNPEEAKYAGLLLVGVGHILYGLYDQEYDKTTRMV